MLPPACAGCGAPLPPHPADPAHPEWCNLCAAQARTPAPDRSTAPFAGPPPLAAPGLGAPATAVPGPMPGAMPVPPTASGLVVQTRVLDGVLTGVAAAGIGGALWWAISSLSGLDQWHFLAVIVGFVVAQGVLIGSRRGGAGPAVVALVCSVVAVLVAAYFIDRSLTVQALADAGRTADVPLWQGVGDARSTVWWWVDNQPGKAVGWLLAPIVAVAMTLPKAARPLIT